MPEPTAHPVKNLLIEILAPPRSSCRGTVICDCCRQWKLTSEFDDDGCGICLSCLDSDDILVELETEVRGRETSSENDRPRR
jgi:hypothetical protein